MPPQKEVKSLKRLSVESVGKFIECVSLELVAIVSEFCKRDPNLGFSFLKTSISHLAKHLFDNIPAGLVDDVKTCVLQLLPKLMSDLRSSYMRCFWADTFMIQMRTVTLLINVLLHEKIQTMDVSSLPRVMQHVLMADLHKMSGLKQLNLGTGSSGLDISDNEIYILNGLTCMKNLVQLHLAVDCTDAIVKCIKMHCAHIEVLSIAHSRSVTQRCVPYLVQMRKLKCLDIEGTSISCEGYTQLLSQLSELFNIGRCDFIDPVLHELCTQRKYLRLTFLACKVTSDETIQLIVDRCPVLTNLVLEKVQETDITYLARLKHLRHLALGQGSVHRMKLIPFLQSYPYLVGLNLTRVHTLDELCLMHISDHCPNLQSLCIDSCECVARRSPLVFSNLKYNKYFAGLTCLSVLFTECDSEHLDILLKSCLGLTVIHMTTSVPNDAYMQRLLAVNPLKELITFDASCHTLSVNSIDALIQHCPNLTRISDLRKWSLVSKNEYNALLERIRRENLNLTIVASGLSSVFPFS